MNVAWQYKGIAQSAFKPKLLYEIFIQLPVYQKL